MALISRTQVIPLGNYSGSRTFGPVTLSDAATLIYLELARCTTVDNTIWPDVSTTLTCTIEVSVDGGANWSFAGGFSSQGGIATRPSGDEYALTSLVVKLSPGTSRQARATIIITNGPLRTQGFVELRN